MGEEADGSPQRSVSMPLIRRASTRNAGGLNALPHFAAVPEDFIGREFFQCRVLAFLEGGGGKPRRCVCVHGKKGIGKTALLKSIAGFVNAPGRLFDGGVLYDESWAARKEPLPWLWLEAVWELTGHERWEQEEAGLQPESPTDVLMHSLCEQLKALREKDILLVVDDANLAR